MSRRSFASNRIKTSQGTVAVETLSVGIPITVPAFAAPGDAIRHFFGTKLPAAPSTHGPAALGLPADWLPERRTNGSRGRNRGRAGAPIIVVSVHQVHGTDVLVVDRAMAGEQSFPGAWDAIVTNQVGVLVTVRTADCAPVLIHDTHKGVVAAVHAGWRGAVAGILPTTLSLIQRRFGSKPASLRIGIGPSVGPCCYEVDTPVLERLRDNFPGWSAVIRQTGPDKAMLDLRKLLRCQAELEGVAAEQIKTVRVCTACHANLFHSYRRERALNGTMVSGIMLTGSGSSA